jgi:hypothetical protein
MAATFQQWTAEVDALCMTHLACSWADLCGDIAPLQLAFDAGESPAQFVLWWAEKYDLTWLDVSGKSH